MYIKIKNSLATSRAVLVKIGVIKKLLKTGKFLKLNFYDKIVRKGMKI